jgi:dolichyl-phosphate beta-glucosyltransferase
MSGETIVVVPCFNEERRLNAEAFKIFAAENPSVRFLFVDDGSRDGTPAKLEALARFAPERLSVLRLDANAGKGEAVRRGLLAAFERGPAFAGYWDADLATPLEAILDLRRALEEKPGPLMVLGSRVRLLGRAIERNPRRHYAGRLFATAASLVLRLPVYDTQCGAKLFRNAEETRALFAAPFAARWVFDVEIIARLKNSARPIEETVFEHPLSEWRDREGSKISWMDFPGALWDLWKIGRTYGGRG